MTLKEKKIRVSKKKTVKTGIFTASMGAYGFVTPTGSNTGLLVPSKYVGKAIDGDFVEFQEFSEKNPFSNEKTTVAKIISVTERTRTFVTGVLITPHTMTPMNPHLPETIKINEIPRGVKKGDWIIAQILPSGKRHAEKIKASCVQVLGHAGELPADVDAVLAEYQLPEKYTEKDEQVAEHLKQIKIDREDLTHLYAITIDPSNAHDFDDAISISPGTKKNEIILGIHIADVATWIATNSHFDKSAMHHCFSSYIPGRFNPMLPSSLTKKMSMREGVVSYAHSILLTVRKTDGKIISSKRVHSLVKIRKRLSFEALQNFIDEPQNNSFLEWDAELTTQIQQLLALVSKIRKKRLKDEHFLNLEISEVNAICKDESFNQIIMKKDIQNEASLLIEECMLAANSVVAKEIEEKKIRCFFRIHSEPNEIKLKEFNEFMKEALQSNDELNADRESCFKFLKTIEKHPKKDMISCRFLRTLPRAIYDTTSGLHFGLGKKLYTHFTSPLRRYPDLILHQQLLNYDLGKRMRSLKRLKEILGVCNIMEKRYDEAYYAANDRLKLHYLRSHSALSEGTMFEANIQKITSTGLVCNVSDLGLFGFLPFSNLRKSFRRNSSSRYNGHIDGNHTDFRVGDFIYVRATSIDFIRGTLYLNRVI